MEDDYQTSAEYLAEELGGNPEDYEPDAEMPELKDLESVPAEEFYDE